jgi:hypothetical protein
MKSHLNYYWKTLRNVLSRSVIEPFVAGTVAFAGVLLVIRVIGGITPQTIEAPASEPDGDANATQPTTNGDGESTSSEVVPSADEEAWRSCVGRLLDAAQERQAAGVAAHRSILDHIAEIVASDGIDRFIEVATSWESKGMNVRDPIGWRSWLRERYVEQTFPEIAVTEAINHGLSEWNRVLDEIDDRTLVELELDVDLDEARGMFETVAFETAAVQRAVSSAVDAIIPLVQDANVEGAVRRVGGFLVGAAIGNAASDQLNNEDGSTSWEGAVGGLLAGVAAEWVGDMVVEEVSDTSEKLHAVVADETTNLAGCASEELNSRVFADYYLQEMSRRERALAIAVAASFDVDEDWSVAVYNAERERRREAQE